MAILEARFDIVLAIDLVSSVFIILTLKKQFKKNAFKYESSCVLSGQFKSALQCSFKLTGQNQLNYNSFFSNWVDFRQKMMKSFCFDFSKTKLVHFILQKLLPKVYPNNDHFCQSKVTSKLLVSLLIKLYHSERLM